MYYRRKIILSLIDLLGGEVEKLRFQKLLFLFSMRKEQPEYDFVPYKFGCYSFSANADMNTMIKNDILIETENKYKKQDRISYFKKIKTQDLNLLKSVIADYGNMSSNALIKHTYLNFPFYATQSKIAKEVLAVDLYKRVKNEIQDKSEIALFTLGYEGISLEKYLQKLLLNNIKLLIDVRRNPLSMKFGFGKALLIRFCNSINIEYIHIPEVGIASENRQNLKKQSDYDKLFTKYRKTTLKDTIEYQNQIIGLIQKHKRVVLSCFEADPKQCHRTHLAKAVNILAKERFPLIHL